MEMTQSPHPSSPSGTKATPSTLLSSPPFIYNSAGTHTHTHTHTHTKGLSEQVRQNRAALQRGTRMSHIELRPGIWWVLEACSIERRWKAVLGEQSRLPMPKISLNTPAIRKGCNTSARTLVKHAQNLGFGSQHRVRLGLVVYACNPRT